jgi:hypothetical protein
MVQDLWQAPQKPAEQVASVQQISEAKRKRQQRTGSADLSAVMGSVVAAVQPITAQAEPAAEIMQALPKEVAALVEQAKQVLLLKANTDPNLSSVQKLTLVAQA